MVKTMSDRKMYWLQDIVPNHMALSAENPILVDVLENGPLSKYYRFLDIEWNHAYETLKGKLLIPLLGDYYGTCLEEGNLQLQFDATGLHVTYFDSRFPLRMESYATVFGRRMEELRDRMGNDQVDLLKLLAVLYTVRNLPPEENIQERYEQIGFVKTFLWELFTAERQYPAAFCRIAGGV